MSHKVRKDRTHVTKRRNRSLKVLKDVKHLTKSAKNETGHLKC